MRFLIAYDLRNTKRGYDDIDGCVRSFGTTIRVLISTWIVETDMGAHEIADHLKNDDLEGADRFLVATVSAPWSGEGLECEVDISNSLGKPHRLQK